MLNVIRMELHRMFRMRSFYFTLALCVAMIVGLICLMAPMLNQGTDSSQVGGVSLTISEEGQEYFEQEGVAADFAMQFIALSSTFIVIFMACFVDSFNAGFRKNVIAKVRNRWYFQISNAVVVLVYAAIVLAVTTIVSLGLCKGLIHGFTFDNMDMLLRFLVGEYGLLAAMGVFSVFFTELSDSKIPSIVICLAAANIINVAMIPLNNKLSEWLSRDIAIQRFFPLLYQPEFQSENVTVKVMLHAVVLSLVFFVIYNAAGAALISKRDVK